MQELTPSAVHLADRLNVSGSHLASSRSLSVLPPTWLPSVGCTIYTNNRFFSSTLLLDTFISFLRSTSELLLFSFLHTTLNPHALHHSYAHGECCEIRTKTSLNLATLRACNFRYLASGTLQFSEPLARNTCEPHFNCSNRRESSVRSTAHFSKPALLLVNSRDTFLCDNTKRTCAPHNAVRNF